ARDELFRHAEPGGPFRFDAAVARVLPDMLRRSIPGYSLLLEMIALLAEGCVREDELVYDLGCSLGGVTLAVRRVLGARPARLCAIDSSPAMTDRLDELVREDAGLCPVEIRCEDVRDTPLEPMRLAVLNFTLQFLPVADRDRLVQRISEQLLPGGFLIVSEKVLPPGPAEQALFLELHDSFREARGYSRLELARKRRALEEVLVEEAERAHTERLEGAGLDATRWFQGLQFVSFVAK